MTRRTRPETSDAKHGAPTRAPRERRSTLPWTSVAAGAAVVVAAVSTAGVVGAATGGVHAVVVPSSLSEGRSLDGSDIPVVEPRPEHDVTRVPPAQQDDAPTRGTTRPAHPESEEPSGDDPTSDHTSSTDPSSDPTTEPRPTTSGTAGTDAPTGDGADDGAAHSAEPDPTADPDAGTDEAGVAWVQERLVAFGAELEPTGVLDAATVAALTAFQQASGLVPTGTVTGETVQALAEDPPTADITEPSDGSGGANAGDSPTDEPTTADSKGPAGSGSTPTEGTPTDG